MTKQDAAYELEHWAAMQWSAPYAAIRAARSMALLGPVSGPVVVDVGCGPRCGIFSKFDFDHMYAVDPLWHQYQEQGLAVIREGVQIITATADSFVLPELADTIVSVNALDHSGDLPASVAHILAQLRPGGRFCLHVHLRTASQLNAGHRMIVSAKQLDDALASCHIEKREVYQRCPIEGKGYQTYVGRFRKLDEPE